MIYIIVALKAEAQAFVDKYRLKNYTNGDIRVVVSGIGAEAMFKTTCKILQNFTSCDLILNVGICGASKKYKIGQLIDARYHVITCIDYEAKNTKHDIVDMESLGFKQATKEVQNSFIFKIVSDHFEPQRVTKDKAKQLIFCKIDEIMSVIYQS